MSPAEYLLNKARADEAESIAARPSLRADLGVLNAAWSVTKVEFLRAIPRGLGEPILRQWAENEGWSA